MRQVLFLLPVASWVAASGCSDPKSVVDQFTQAAEQAGVIATEATEETAKKDDSLAEQAVQSADRFINQALPVANTHESLHDAMLRCEENVCDILESLNDVPSVREAEPRLATQIKRYREIAHRYLLLGEPDEAESKRLAERFGERQRKNAVRELEATSRLMQNDELKLAVGLLLSDFQAARVDFTMKLQGLMLARARGGDAAAPPSTEELERRETAAAAIAGALDQLAAGLANVHDAASAKQQASALEAGVRDLRDSVEQFNQLPIVQNIQLEIRLQPSKERVAQAYRQYSKANEDAKSNALAWQYVFPIEREVERIMFRLQNKGLAAERGGPVMAGPPTGGGAPPGRPDLSRPGGGKNAGKVPDWVQQARDSRKPPPVPPSASRPLEGPDVATIYIAEVPKESRDKVTARLQSLCNSSSYHVNARNDRYTFVTRPVSDLRRLAEKIDFGTVIQIDEATRTITLQVDPSRL